LETSPTNHKVYLDGGNQGSDTASAVPSYTDTMSVGAMAYNDSWVNFFAGKIGAVAVWNIALSPADQASLAAGADPATIQPSNLVGCWPLVSDAQDVSGNGCHLTVAGSATFDADDHPDIGDSYVDMSVTSGGTGGGVSSLRSGQMIDVSVTAGGTGGGSIMLIGSSAWAGQHDTKQYVVAIGNGQVWICEV
jgi:hypothetical protein